MPRLLHRAPTPRLILSRPRLCTIHGRYPPRQPLWSRVVQALARTAKAICRAKSTGIHHPAFTSFSWVPCFIRKNAGLKYWRLYNGGSPPHGLTHTKEALHTLLLSRCHRVDKKLVFPSGGYLRGLAALKSHPGVKPACKLVYHALVTALLPMEHVYHIINAHPSSAPPCTHLSCSRGPAGAGALAASTFTWFPLTCVRVYARSGVCRGVGEEHARRAFAEAARF